MSQRLSRSATLAGGRGGGGRSGLQRSATLSRGGGHSSLHPAGSSAAAAAAAGTAASTGIVPSLNGFICPVCPNFVVLESETLLKEHWQAFHDDAAAGLQPTGPGTSAAGVRGTQERMKQQVCVCVCERGTETEREGD